MTQVIKYVWDGYQYLFQELPDPRTASLPLTKNPIEILLIVGIYLKFVLDWGPKFMKNREAFDLKYVMLCYNLFQIGFNSYIVYLAFRYAYIEGNYNLACEPVNYTNDFNSLMVLRGTYLYYISKVFDLLETVFFILRKKWRQISFLHLFHHAIMCVIGFIGATYIPGGHTIFSGFFNSFVHVVMYIYYFCSAIDKDGSMVWWKKHLTQLQIVQFLFVGVHWITLLLHPGCGYPKGIAAIAIPPNLSFLVLFANFYYHTYIKNKKKSA